MLFNSREFLLFFPIVVLLYYLIPHKFRYIWICVTSYFFYMCWNPVYGLLLLGVTCVTYLCARLIAPKQALGNTRNLAQRKWLLAGTITVCLVLLGIFKYLQFFTNTIQKVFHAIHIYFDAPVLSIVIPVGISFYLFQSLGYVIDVYRGKVKVEKKLILYAAYISFFPQLVAGPIERADKLLPQFSEEHKFDYDRVKSNLLLMLWGFFMKIVVADRTAQFVDTVYDNYSVFGGWLVIVATVLFAFQIYCDFAGYSLIAKGAAGVMGFELMDNFRSPYCASGIREFWSRWHISLTSWFRDYIYIPLGGNRKGRLRKYINTLIVFFLSGPWHGPSWSYVLWGGLNGAFIVGEEIISSIKVKISSVIKVTLPAAVRRVIGTLITFCLVDFTWIFFRARGIRESFEIIKSMLTFSNAGAFSDNTVNFQIMDIHNFRMAIISIMVLLFVDICHCRDIHFREILERQNIVIRWFVYWAFIMFLLIFGIWGPNFDKTAFIYFQF